MDISGIDLGVILTLVAMIVRMSQDKANAAEQMGRLKQQVASLEARGSRWDNRFESLESKLEVLIAAVTRIEVLCERDHKARTPLPQRGQSRS
ncbi:hypothetical protein [uncultured Idiomarina sp.]|uniref:hypothetical protein n=1 Tax=uncultured Idiomarina sp. TaxID=352961 RepID=UPI0032B3038F|tara:strand:+ start:650 stop:928 length:279 start_codon:yes stop_codon:yes gene_type:complete